MRKAFTILFSALLLIQAKLPSAYGQSTPVRITVDAGASVTSPRVVVRAGEAFVVRFESSETRGTPYVRVFVHSADGTLAAVEDPEQSTDTAAFSLASGSYYAIIRNTGDAGAVVAISIERARGFPRRAERALVRVFFATDRERRNDIQFGTEPASSLTYGHADVTLPRVAHEMGELEGPSIWKLEFTANPEKHVIMQRPILATEREFFAAVGERVKGSARRECLVFVHGFNVSFEDAIRRMGQISYDLGFDGAPIVFSWPSQGRMLPADYRKDERNAALSADALRRLLELLASGNPGLTVHIVAHSMGSRVVSGALQQLAAKPQRTTRKPVRQVALLAPDIDAELFRRSAGKLVGVVERLTLYASEIDQALAFSRRNAGYKRAGQAGQDIVIVRGVDTVDATRVETSLLGLGHSYYADNSTILSDLFHLLRGRPPEERGARLEPAGTPPNGYWRFRQAAR